MKQISKHIIKALPLKVNENVSKDVTNIKQIHKHIIKDVLV